MAPRTPIGLLAGSGRFPILFAEKARRLGLSVACVGLRDNASPDLIPLVDHFDWCGVVRMGSMIRCFKRRGVKQIVMAGKIQKTMMHTPFKIFRLLPDWRTLRAWYRGQRK